MLIPIKLLGEKGDTIVEVLFAIVVIALVLTGSYSVVNHSLIEETDAQQHSYALGLVQGQIEQLRAYLLTSSSNVFNGTCMSNGSVVSGSGCAVQQNNAGAVYDISISKTITTPITYTVQASWYGAVNPSYKDNISISYRSE